MVVMTMDEPVQAPVRTTLPAKPQRILVADDEHLVAASLRSSLMELGFVVIGPASDGDHAIELARSQKPDMALLDIRMPNKDGIATGEVLARQFGIPVVIVSAFSDPDYLEACNRFQTFGFLLKPVTQDELRVTIDIAWGRYRDYLEERGNVERLKVRLEDRRIIEQAKWLLVNKKGITEPDAMRLLQRQARNNRRTLVDVAKSLIENDQLLG